MECRVWITRCFLFCVRYSAILETPVCINRINNRLVFKIKDGYKLDLQTPETIKLFGNTKKLIEKTKNGEEVQGLEAVEVIFVQYNLVDNQCQ